ncbi:E3 SUMO-protein ligase pli1 [Acyrthosiphon pisum]|uniref:SP-RING-type domain-containing protein n=1 Tax=Acyrthosiphon pisum TaxID=7029 RepID=A0A8R2A9N2_ACYPI|nr:E3 SUMO-protein ligase pli1 [Acyrthosiphon pisum]|eukprot:XP_003240550.1 PREDICTED: E3 SUMO-protein ligase pli1-like [Acyrthosiphon pisum]
MDEMDDSPEVHLTCPAPRHECIMNGNYEFYIHGSLVMDPASIQFKTLPFQHIINQVVPPICIDFTPIISLAGLNNVRNHLGVEFYLSLSDVQKICPTNRGGKQASLLQIRIGERLSGMSKLSEELPQPVLMSINSKQILMNDLKSPINVNAIDYLHLNTVDANEITISWPPCKRIYYMLVNLVDIISVEELVEDIKMDNDRFCLALETKKKAMELLKNSSKDLKTFNLTLLCPINKSKMILPVKSVNCHHLQCFDLQAFIYSNKIVPTWICPICTKDCILDDLKIDSFLLFIINSIKLPKTCEEIQLDANGKWKPCILNSDSREGILGTSCSLKKTILEIDLGNSDDEEFCDFVKTGLPIKSAGNSNGSKPKICMNTTSNTLEIKTEEPLFKIIKKEETND